MRIKELADGRFIGFEAFEIAAFPAVEGDSGQEIDAEIERNCELFRRMVQEFHALGCDADTVTELLWLTDKAEKQTFRSRIRIFCVVRKIGRQSDVETGIERLRNHFMSAVVSKQYPAEPADPEEFGRLLERIDNGCLFAVAKAEKCAGNAASPYPYYYSDVIPAQNTDNFTAIVAAMSQYENCCISFQLFPARLTQQERLYLNEVTGELGRMAGGVYTNRQMYTDTAAAEPYRVLSGYLGQMDAPLFLYNILVFGGRADCADLAAKIVSLLQAGKKRMTNPGFCCLDLSGEKVNLPAQFLHYPWNVNNRLVYTYRNRRLIASVPMAKMLFRLPYIVTAEEASVFFRLPLREKTMAALRGNQAGSSAEQFDDAVVAGDSIRFGALLAHGVAEVVIGCPENAFTKHALVVGTPGSGKTTFAFNLLLQFARRGIPFLAIEPTKAEYRAMIDAIPDLQIFTPGNNRVAPYIVNPFIPPEGVGIEQYIPSLAGAFKAAFSMPSPLDIIFLRAVRTCYAENGWKDYSRHGDPDVTDFGLYEFILTFKRIISESNYSAEVKGNLQSAGVFRLMNLLEQNSNIFDTVHTVPIKDMLCQPTVLELNAIDNTEQKALIMALLLIGIGVYTKNSRRGDGALKNIILMDEAHVLFGGGAVAPSTPTGTDSQMSAVKSMQDMIAEIRSYGTGIIIADQSPTKVGREVVANTDIKVAFRLVQSAEKDLIADSTNMDEVASRQLSRLKPGEAYVYFSRLENPQLVTTGDIREKEHIRLDVPNGEIAARMTYWETRKQELKPFAECEYGTACQNGCDFAIRAEADYYANRLVAAHLAKIKDVGVFKTYLLGMEKLLANKITGMDVEQKERILKCTAIRFVRKVQLEASLRLTKTELRGIFVAGGKNG
jgi:hypothetical protein